MVSKVASLRSLRVDCNFRLNGKLDAGKVRLTNDVFDTIVEALAFDVLCRSSWVAPGTSEHLQIRPLSTVRAALRKSPMFRYRTGERLQSD